MKELMLQELYDNYDIYQNGGGEINMIQLAIWYINQYDIDEANEEEVFENAFLATEDFNIKETINETEPIYI